MSQGVVNPDRSLGAETRRRVRFDIARSQLMVVTAAVALLALLFFLSGLAIGLLVNPRLTPAGNLLQSAVLPRPSEPPPPRRGSFASGKNEPPASGPADESATATWRLDADIAGLVWQPRQPRQPGGLIPQTAATSEDIAAEGATAEDATAEGATAEGATAEGGTVDIERSPGEPARFDTEVPTDSAGLASNVLASNVLASNVLASRTGTDGGPEVTYQPRPGGLAQPPSRWRRAQPLAVAFLTSPDDWYVPALPSQAEPTDGASTPEEDDVEEAAEDLPLASELGTHARAVDSTSADARWTASSAPDPSSRQTTDDDGWQPTSSHWQSFYGSLMTSPGEIPKTTALADTSTQGANTVWAAKVVAPVDGVDIDDATGDAASGADPSTDDASADDDSGWQPSSDLWQSFLEDPYDWTAERLPPPPPRPATAGEASPGGSMAVPYGDLMDRAAARHGVDVALVAAMVRVESSYDAQAVSHRGARGLMQVMPATARRFGVAADDLFDPAVNLDVGLRYLSWLGERFDGDASRMLAAYNAGEAAVDTHDGIPPFAETQQYVQRIYGLMGWALPGSEP